MAGDEATPGVDRNAVLIARYRVILDRSPQESFALERYVALHRERDGSLAPLRDRLAAEVVAEPSALSPRLLLGEVLRRLGDDVQAEFAFVEASRIAPGASAPHIVLARLSAHRYRRGEEEPERYLQRLRIAVEHSQGELRREFLEALAGLSLDTGDLEGAAGHYRRLASAPDASIHQRGAFARALFERGMHARSAEAYDALLRQLRGDPRVLPPVLLDAARARRLSGDTDGAREALHRALALAQRSPGLRRELYDELAELSRGDDNLPALIELLERRRDPEAGRMAARLWDELGDLDQALASYRRVLRGNPRDLDSRLRLVQLLTRGGRLDEVVEEYRTLLRLAPREGRFVQELAQLLMQLGREAEAQALAARTLRQSRRDPAMLNMLLQLYSAWGEAAKADEILRLLLRRQPNDPSSIIALGQRELEAGNQGAALDIWRRLLRIPGAPGDAQGTLAELLVEQAMYPEAEEHYRRALQMAPGNVELLRGLANVLEQREGPGGLMANREEVLRLWNEVRQRATGRAAGGTRREARRRIVGVYRRTGMLPGQLQRWQRDFSAEPPDLEAGRLLVEAYWSSPDERRALAAVLERLLAIAPGDLEAMRTLERFHTLAGDLSQAIASLERLVEADPARAAQYFDRMAAHATVLYRDADALRYSQEAVRRDPEDAGRHRHLGDLYRAQLQPEAALESYAQALARNDRLFPVYTAVAELHLAQGELPAAIAAYEEVLLRCSDDELVAAAGRELLSLVNTSEALASLEARLLAEVLRQPRRALLRRILVQVYGRLTSEARAGELERLGRRALKPLLESLVDDYPGIRDTALEVLHRTANPQAADALLRLGEEEGAPGASRAKALRTLGSLPLDAAHVPRLRALAEEGGRQGSMVRLWAAWALASRAGASSAALAPVLEEALLELAEGRNVQVAGYAMLGLARLEPSRRGRSAREACLSRAATAQSATLRSIALFAQAMVDQAVGTHGADRDSLPSSQRPERWAWAFDAGAPGELAVAAMVIGQEPWQGDAAAFVGEYFFSPRAELRDHARAAFAGRYRGVLRRERPIAAPRNLRPFESLEGFLPDGASESLSWLTETDLPTIAEQLLEAIQEGLAGPPEVVSAVLRFLAPPDGSLPFGLGRLSLRYPEWDEGTQQRFRALCALLQPRLGGFLRALSAHPQSSVRRLAALRMLQGAEHPEDWRFWLQDPEVVDVLLPEIAPGGETGDLPQDLLALVEESAQWSRRLRSVQALGRLLESRGLDEQGRNRVEALLQREPHPMVRRALRRLLDGATEVGSSHAIH